GSPEFDHHEVMEVIDSLGHAGGHHTPGGIHRHCVGTTEGIAPTGENLAPLFGPARPRQFDHQEVCGGGASQNPASSHHIAIAIHGYRPGRPRDGLAPLFSPGGAVEFDHQAASSHHIAIAIHGYHLRVIHTGENLAPLFGPPGPAQVVS